METAKEKNKSSTLNENTRYETIKSTLFAEGTPAPAHKLHEMSSVPPPLPNSPPNSTRSKRRAKSGAPDSKAVPADGAGLRTAAEPVSPRADIRAASPSVRAEVTQPRRPSRELSATDLAAKRAGFRVHSSSGRVPASMLGGLRSTDASMSSSQLSSSKRKRKDHHRRRSHAEGAAIDDENDFSAVLASVHSSSTRSGKRRLSRSKHARGGSSESVHPIMHSSSTPPSLISSMSSDADVVANGAERKPIISPRHRKRRSSHNEESNPTSEFAAAIAAVRLEAKEKGTAPPSDGEHWAASGSDGTTSDSRSSDSDSDADNGKSSGYDEQGERSLRKKLSESAPSVVPVASAKRRFGLRRSKPSGDARSLRDASKSPEALSGEEANGGSLNSSGVAGVFTHLFDLFKSVRPVRCHKCRHLVLRGTIFKDRQGRQCRVCKMVVHVACDENNVHSSHVRCMPEEVSATLSRALNASSSQQFSDFDQFAFYVTHGDVDMLRELTGGDKLRTFVNRMLPDGVPVLVASVQAYVSQPSEARLDAFRLLLEHASPRALQITGDDGWGVVQCAIASAYDSCLALDALVDSGKVTEVPSDAMCVLCHHFHRPAFQRYFDWLIEVGGASQLSCQSGSKNNTPMHYACANQSIGGILVRALVDGGADVNVTNARSETPLFSAVYANQADIVAYLVNETDAVVDWANKDGLTPAQVCDEMTSLQIRTLLTHNLGSLGSDPSITDLNNSAGSRLLRLKGSASRTRSSYTTGVARYKTSSEATNANAGSGEARRELSVTTSDDLRTPWATLSSSNSLVSPPVSVTDVGPVVKAIDSALQRGIAEVIEESADVLKIPYESLTFYESLGEGTYGCVYRGVLNCAQISVPGVGERKRSGDDTETETEATASVASVSDGRRRSLVSSVSGRYVEVEVPEGDNLIEAANQDHERLDRLPVAIKAFHRPAASMDEFIDHFAVWSALKHPNVVKLLGVCVELDEVYMVMELSWRGSLLDALQTDFMYGWPLVLRWCSDLLAGLNYLHTLKPSPVLHRDVKPSNLMLTLDWRVQLADFDTARRLKNVSASSDEEGGGGDDDNSDKKSKRRSLLQSNASLKKLEAAIGGSPAYLAVEVFNDGGSVYTDRSDIYSAGITLNELLQRVLLGRYVAPYSLCSEVANRSMFMGVVMYAAGDANGRPRIADSCPLLLRQLVERMWHRTPQWRPSAAESLTLLKTVVSEYLRDRAQWDALLATPPPEGAP